jgi:uncharacterized membrane protein
MNGKILPIALAVSLTVNVFVIGAAVGALGARARFMPHRPPPGAAMGGGGGGPIMRAADELPADVATAYRQRMRTEAEASRPMLQEARAARQAAAEAFAQPTFDKQAALTALAKSRAGETGARERLETAVVEFAADLPQDQRRVLSRALRQPGRGGPGGRRGGPGMGGPGRGGPGGPFPDSPPEGEPR